MKCWQVKVEVLKSNPEVLQAVQSFASDFGIDLSVENIEIGSELVDGKVTVSIEGDEIVSGDFWNLLEEGKQVGRLIEW